MKIFLVLAALCTVSLAKSVTLLKQSELPEELIKNPRYILWETEEGLIEVEDLQSNETTDGTLFVTESDVSFYVYTSENQVDGVQIRESQLQNIVELTGFNVNRPTLVIIHGWKNSFESPVNVQIRNAAFILNDINVIVVDWNPISRRTYLTAQGSVLDVGNYIGDILLRLVSELNYSISQLTIVGHSLGAHISGNVGARTNGAIPIIVGLDPAGPLFTRRNTDNRLDPTDGQFVHVIHTNDGLLGYGINMGYADYYPNGGSSQPGCGIDLVGTCAHNRAFEFFAESLYNNNFLSRLCDSFRNFDRNRCDDNVASLMGGYPVEEAEHGEYYLTTNRESLFAQG